MKYYSLKNIKKRGAIYNVIFGERSNGKSYSVLDEILKNYCEKGEQGGIIRRWDTDLQGRRASVLFEPLVINRKVTTYTDGEWDFVTYYAGRWYLARFDEKTRKTIKDDTPFCYAFALNTMEHDKSTSYPLITTVLFDEFITRRGYLDNEFVIFMNEISTIVRERSNIIIYMLGNTVNMDCPYFSEMGLTHVKEMRQGDIDTYTYGESGLKVAVEFCGESARQSKKSDKYFAFDNPRLQMITGKGQLWEIGVYPHKPMDYKPKDVKFIFFIRYNDDMVQGEVVIGNGYNFLFIHPKTTPIKRPGKDIVFDSEYSPLFTSTRKLGQSIGRTSITSKIMWYFKNDKVFFSDNKTGDIVRNYLIWCSRAKINS